MSFNQFSQTLEEMIIMEQFRNSYPEFPKGKLIKSESPDFIVQKTFRKTIGIELTKLHSPLVAKLKTHYPLRISGYQAPELNQENIEFTINAKNEKINIYRKKKLNHLWLMITADLDNSPVSFNLSNQLDRWIFFSEFEKVFLFELKNRKVFELNIRLNF